MLISFLSSFARICLLCGLTWPEGFVSLPIVLAGFKSLAGIRPPLILALRLVVVLTFEVKGRLCPATSLHATSRSKRSDRVAPGGSASMPLRLDVHVAPGWAGVF